MRVKRYEQPEVFLDELEAAGITHGAIVRADVIDARTAISPETGGELVGAGAGRPRIFFCDMPQGAGVQVKQTIAKGDGGPVAEQVFVAERLRLAIQELNPWTVFTIEDAVVSTNGRTRIDADGLTRLVITEVAGKKRRQVVTV